MKQTFTNMSNRTTMANGFSQTMRQSPMSKGTMGGDSSADMASLAKIMKNGGTTPGVQALNY